MVRRNLIAILLVCISSIAIADDKAIEDFDKIEKRLDEIDQAMLKSIAESEARIKMLERLLELIDKNNRKDIECRKLMDGSGSGKFEECLDRINNEEYCGGHPCRITPNGT